MTFDLSRRQELRIAASLVALIHRAPRAPARDARPELRVAAASSASRLPQVAEQVLEPCSTIAASISVAEAARVTLQIGVVEKFPLLWSQIARTYVRVWLGVPLVCFGPSALFKRVHDILQSSSRGPRSRISY